MDSVPISTYPGVDGFLGTRGSLMLDVVFLTMFLVVPLLGWSIWLAKRQRFALHKRVQVTLALVLLLAVTAFEIEMRVVGWRERALPSPFWTGPEWNDWVHYSLAIHLFFAIPTALLWLVVVVRALRQFPKPPAPNHHSQISSVLGHARRVRNVHDGSNRLGVLLVSLRCRQIVSMWLPACRQPNRKPDGPASGMLEA